MADHKLLKKCISEAVGILHDQSFTTEDRLKPEALPLLGFSDADWKVQASRLWLDRQMAILEAFSDESLGLIITGQLKPRQLIWELIDPTQPAQSKSSSEG